MTDSPYSVTLLERARLIDGLHTPESDGYSVTGGAMLACHGSQTGLAQEADEVYPPLHPGDGVPAALEQSR